MAPGASQLSTGTFLQRTKGGTVRYCLQVLSYQQSPSRFLGACDAQSGVDNVSVFVSKYSLTRNSPERALRCWEKRVAYVQAGVITGDLLWILPHLDSESRGCNETLEAR